MFSSIGDDDGVNVEVKQNHYYNAINASYIKRATEEFLIAVLIHFNQSHNNIKEKIFQQVHRIPPL
jgi:hypothetical protein